MNNKQQQRILQYLSEHSELFDTYERMYINEYVRLGVIDKFLPDVIRELYDKFAVIPDEDNIYLAFIELMKRHFDIENSHIIEVGGGIFPCLGRRISLLQNKGTITVYDPRLCKDEQENSHLYLRREKFDRNTPIGDTDLMIGFMPCKGAEALVESATSNEVDFIVALCEGGPHGDIYDYFESDEEWIHSILYRAERGIEDHDMGQLQVEYFKKYQNPYPIIYNKKN